MLRGRDDSGDDGCCADEAVPKEVLEKGNEYTHDVEEGDNQRIERDGQLARIGQLARSGQLARIWGGGL